MRRRALMVAAAVAATACAESPAADAPRRNAPPAPGIIALDTALLEAALARAEELPRMRSLLVNWRGELVAERYYHGARRGAPANIKSASKAIVSALVGIAIAEGHIDGVHETLGKLLPDATRGLAPEKRAITVEDLLTMRAGLESTSFDNYGAWVTSRNWVRHALAQPMVAEAGSEMIYSTGSTHLLSAILTRATGTSTWRFARRELADPLAIRLPAWTTDPQGIYFGGNEMRLTPRAMMAFGLMYLRGGRSSDGEQIVPQAWIDSSWIPRAVSPWSGFSYGYGWWIDAARGHPVYFAWGYGGQFIFVVPSLELVVVATSDPNASSRGGRHLDAVHDLLAHYLVPAAGG